MTGIIVDMWSHAFGNFTKVTNKVAVFTTLWKDESHCCEFDYHSTWHMVDIPTRCLVRLKAFIEGPVCLMGRRGSIIDDWNNSGHVKSRLWEFHQSDKQSGCVHYYMEGTGTGKETFSGWSETSLGLSWVGSSIVDDIPTWCLVRLKAFIWRSSMPQKTGMFWTESWMGLSNRLVLAWEGQWLGWRDFCLILSCDKSSQISIWFAMEQGRCGLVANGKAERWAIRESWESAVTEFSASCKQFPLKVVIFVSINWQEELNLKNVGPGGQGGFDWQTLQKVSKH
jgi:hypothetical protein